MGGAWAAIIQAGVQILGEVAAGWQGARMGKEQEQRGLDMQYEAKNLSGKFPRPELETPEAIKLRNEMSQGRQYQNMPGMTMQQNQIDQATAGGVSTMEKMGTGAEAFGGVADLYKNKMDASREVAKDNAAYQERGQEGYLKDLEQTGEWEQKAWEWNEADPYLVAQEKAAQLDAAGRQGEWEGVKTRMGAWAETFSGISDAMGGGGGLSSLTSMIGSK